MIEVSALDLLIFTLLTLDLPVNLLELFFDALLIFEQALIILTVLQLLIFFILFTVTIPLYQVTHISHSRGTEARRHLLLLFLVLARYVVVHADLAEPAIHVDLPAVLGLLNLHLSLEVLTEFHHVTLFCHDFVSAGATSDGGFVVFHHVDTHEVLSPSAG
jgi:hypothetical protein